MKKLLLIAIFIASPLMGEENVLRTRSSEEIRIASKKVLEENPKAFWWDFGIINQMEASILIVDNFNAAPWNVTILDLKLGKTSALYFYGQVRFGSSLVGVVNTSIGNSTSYNGGVLVGFGGKYAEMYNTNSVLFSAYMNAGVVVETKRLEETAHPMVYGFEVNNYLVFESSTVSAVLGHTLGFDIHYLNYYDDTNNSYSDLGVSLKFGLQLGVMF